MIRIKNFIKNNKKLVIIGISIVALLGFVYFFSSMDYFKTNDVSKKFTKSIARIIGKSKSEAELNRFVNKANTFIRKLAHLFLFCMLGIFISFVMKLRYKLENKYNLISIAICMMFGMLDELHQKFVPGRSSKLTDVLIDTIGATLGIILVNYAYKRIKPRMYKLPSLCKKVNNIMKSKDTE